MSDFMPECLARYGVTPSLTDPTGSVLALHKLAWELDAKIKSASEAQANSTTEKVTPEFDKAAQKDKKAENRAAQMVTAILTMIETAVTENPNVAYWLAESDKSITQFNTSELQFHRWQTDKVAGIKQSATNDAVAGLKSDRRDVVSFTKRLTGLLPTVMDELVKSNPDMVKKNKGGQSVVNLPNIQGRGAGGETDSPAGKFASLSYMVFNVDGETFPIGTDSRIVLRSIFTGTDRIGKRPGDLYDAMLAANGGNTPKNTGDTVTFTLGGKKVTAVRADLTDEEESDEDDSEE